MTMRGARVGLLLTVLSAALSATAALQLTGRLIVMDQAFDNGDHDISYSLYSKAGKLYRLLDPTGALQEFQTSSDVVVTVNSRSKNVRGALVVDSAWAPNVASLTPPDMAEAGAPPSQRYARTPRVVTQLRALYYVLDICGLGGGPAASVQEVEAALFDGNQSLSSYVNYCSVNRASINRNNTKVVSIRLPCGGISNATGQPWSATTCSGDNLLQVAYLADWYAANVLGVNHMQYTHHVLIYPPNMGSWGVPTPTSDCNWAGNAVLGMAMGTWSYAWLAGDFWDRNQLHLHELGHNYRIGHAATFAGPGATRRIDHGDWSSAMGYCCSDRCLNAPQSWQLGWSSALLALDSSNLDAGIPITLSLPPQGSNTSSFLAIVSDWQRAPRNFFVSYRLTKPLYDVTVEGYIDGLLLHTYDGAMQSDSSSSIFLGTVARDAATGAYGIGSEASSMTDWLYSTGLVVSLISANDTTARIWVCRQDTAVENTTELCTDGLDNDCNGLADSEDPACAGVPPVAALTPPPTTRRVPPLPHQPPRPPVYPTVTPSGQSGPRSPLVGLPLVPGSGNSTANSTISNSTISNSTASNSKENATAPVGGIEADITAPSETNRPPRPRRALAPSYRRGLL